MTGSFTVSALSMLSALSIAPREAAERHKRALAERCVSATAAEDGMSTVCALLPAEGTAALMSALNQAASHPAPDDPRTADQRRADALVQLGINTLGIDAVTGRSCPQCNPATAATSDTNDDATRDGDGGGDTSTPGGTTNPGAAPAL